jgi:hypothetical protein
VQLDGDLLAESPHTLQDTLRALQLVRALGDVLLERRRLLAGRRDATRELLDRALLQRTVVDGVESKEHVQHGDDHGQLEIGRGVDRRPHYRPRKEQMRALGRGNEKCERAKRPEDEPVDPPRLPRDRQRCGAERAEADHDRHLDQPPRRVPRPEQEHAERRHACEMRQGDELGRAIGLGNPAGH